MSSPSISAHPQSEYVSIIWFHEDTTSPFPRHSHSTTDSWRSYRSRNSSTQSLNSSLYRSSSSDVQAKVRPSSRSGTKHSASPLERPLDRATESTHSSRRRRNTQPAISS